MKGEGERKREREKVLEREKGGGSEIFYGKN